MTTMQFLNQETLDQVVLTIVQEVDPEVVILFGFIGEKTVKNPSRSALHVGVANGGICVSIYN